MSLRRAIPALVLLLVLSVTLLVLGAGRSDRSMTAAAALAYAGVIVLTGVVVNWPAWRDPAGQLADGIGLMRRNIRLAALVYAWGAAAILAVYSLSGLQWYHGWQYGLGMALFAAGLLIYVRALESAKRRPPLALTLLHGAAAAGGLGFLIGANKLATRKDDWAANEVFLWGGCAILIINVVAAVSELRLRSAESAGR